MRMVRSYGAGWIASGSTGLVFLLAAASSNSLRLEAGSLARLVIARSSFLRLSGSLGNVIVDFDIGEP